MTSVELRKKYLEFFKARGHALIGSASLIPENDPSVLFTTAGMHPLVPYLLGEKHPAGTRLANVQKCVRLQDIEEVGDNRHDTFFEMLGNWSLGDYFKKEAIVWSWEFLTSQEGLGLDPQYLAVSVFAGDESAPRDEESASVWQSLGVPDSRIAFLPKTNNWWGLASGGPCGPDTEIFYWSGQGQPPLNSNPGNDEANWLEIWNNVFMEYLQLPDGRLEKLAQRNVDTGMGLERTLVALNGYQDVFEVDTFWPLVEKIQEFSGQSYQASPEKTKSMRIVADHLRTAVMIMGDPTGVAPSNTDQGYLVRRLLRRAIRHAKNLGIGDNFCASLGQEVINIFQFVYPEVKQNEEFVLKELEKEENKFRRTLEQGIRLFEQLVADKKQGEMIGGQEAFDLYQSYGFPLEMTQELAQEKGLQVAENEYAVEMAKHQEKSRQGSGQKFKGGLADASEMSIKYHTATHLLQAALRAVLGEAVSQKGSNITTERMRFDFAYPEKMTLEQVRQVEDLVNEAIKQDYEVECQEMSLEEARAAQALGLFSDRYGDRVKVYSIGSAPAKIIFSKEICGGPHVKRTGELGHFRIIKEEASSAGVRRLKAVLEDL
ncbi:MAG TPA: alanine--tRNA ligase [Patescibacteria group bacterium]|nr:alanine--tRNA ligase [Patescibacteria group bacterium]